MSSVSLLIRALIKSLLLPPVVYFSLNDIRINRGTNKE